MAKSSPRLDDLVREIYQKNDEYSELTGAEPNQMLERPATVTQVAAVEKKYGVSLPADYRAFLLSHDGWKGFEEELALLSTDEMLGGAILEWTEYLQKNWSREGGRVPAEGLIIGAAKGNPTIHLFDRTKKRKDGGYDVVKWNADEIIRYHSFTKYLEGTLEILEELIEDEK